MKNSLSLFLFLIFLQSCKKESENQVTKDANPQTIESSITHKDSLQLIDNGVYSGLGTFDANGSFVYLISLPKPTTSNPYNFKLFNINNHTIFIHLDNKSKNELTNTSNNVFELRDTLPKDANSNPYRKSYNVFLWHDDAVVANIADAERIMSGDSLVAPKKTGMGILSRK